MVLVRPDQYTAHAAAGRFDELAAYFAGILR